MSENFEKVEKCQTLQHNLASVPACSITSFTADPIAQETIAAYLQQVLQIKVIPSSGGKAVQSESNVTKSFEQPADEQPQTAAFSSIRTRAARAADEEVIRTQAASAMDEEAMEEAPPSFTRSGNTVNQNLSCVSPSVPTPLKAVADKTQLEANSFVSLVQQRNNPVSDEPLNTPADDDTGDIAGATNNSYNYSSLLHKRAQAEGVFKKIKNSVRCPITRCRSNHKNGAV